MHLLYSEAPSFHIYLSLISPQRRALLAIDYMNTSKVIDLINQIVLGSESTYGVLTDTV